MRTLLAIGVIAALGVTAHAAEPAKPAANRRAADVVPAAAEQDEKNDEQND